MYVGVVPLSLRRSFSLLRHSDFVFPQSFSRSKPYNYVLNSLVDSVHPLLSYVLPLNSLVCLPLLQEIEALVVKATARLSAMQRLLYLDENRQPSLQSFIQQLAHSLSAPSSSSASSDSFDRDSELRHMLAHFTSSDTLILADYMRSRGSIAVDRSEGIARLVGHTQPASLWYSWSSPEGSVSEADVAKWKLANTMGKLRDLDAAYTARIAAVAAALRVNIKVPRLSLSTQSVRGAVGRARQTSGCCSRSSRSRRPWRRPRADSRPPCCRCSLWRRCFPAYCAYSFSAYVCVLESDDSGDECGSDR